MIVVSDTSPITALLAVKEAELLKELFKEVIIPEAVESELLRTHPTLPVWLRVQPLRELSKAKAYARSLWIAARPKRLRRRKNFMPTTC